MNYDDLSETKISLRGAARQLCSCYEAHDLDAIERLLSSMDTDLVMNLTAFGYYLYQAGNLELGQRASTAQETEGE